MAHLLTERTNTPSVLASRYRIRSEIGFGGMAHVFLAEDLTTGRSVAVKVLRHELAASTTAERFHREIQVLRQLHHPHIIPILDSHEETAQLFFVMPYVAGETLRACVTRDGALSLARTVAIAGDVATAIDYAHDLEVVHRDIKPENILLGEAGAFICDFGIVRVLGSGEWERLSSSGVVPGTVAYMSPEQIVAPTTVDRRSDVYAFGCVVYEMLLGHPPFSGRTHQVVIARQLSHPPPPMRTVRPDLPESAERAVMQALAKDPDERQRTAGAFVAALAADL